MFLLHLISDKSFRPTKKAAKFAHHSGGSDCEFLAQRSKTARKRALYKVYAGERAWKAMGG